MVCGLASRTEMGSLVTETDVAGIDHYKLFPDMLPADFRQLVGDILEHGLRDSIIVDERGCILDGHQRWRACLEAAVPPRTKTRRGLTEWRKLKLVVDANRDRLEMDGKPNRRLRGHVASRLARFELGAEQIGQLLRRSASTISRDMELPGVSDGPLPRTQGRDGKSYTRERESRSARLPRVPIENPEYTLVQAAVTEWPRLFSKGSLDAIITETSGTLWADVPAGERDARSPVDFGPLGKLATRVLKRGAPILIMLNHREVEACLKCLSRWHTFRGMLAFELHGARWSTGGKTAHWRPIVCFARGRRQGDELVWPPDGYVADVPGRSDESVHCEDLIATFTKPGDAILDPLLENLGVLFAGIEMGREVVGLRTQDDIDGIDELAGDVLFSHRLGIAVGRFEEEFRFHEGGPGELLVRHRRSRAKPKDLLAGTGGVLLPFLRDELHLGLEEAEEMVEPMLAELRRRGGERSAEA